MSTHEFTAIDVAYNEQIRKQTFISEKYKIPYYVGLAVCIIIMVALNFFAGLLFTVSCIYFFRTLTKGDMDAWREKEQHYYRKQWRQYLFNSAFDGIENDRLDRISYNECMEEGKFAEEKINQLYNEKKIDKMERVALIIPYIYQRGLFEKERNNNKDFDPNRKIEVNRIYMCRVFPDAYDSITTVKYRAEKNMIFVQMLNNFDYWMENTDGNSNR